MTETSNPKIMPVLVHVPLQVLAPDRWEASWDGERLIYKELSLDPEQATRTLHVLKGTILGAPMEQVAPDVIQGTYDARAGHLCVLAEMVLQLESRGYLSPGSTTDIQKWLNQHHPLNSALPAGFF